MPNNISQITTEQIIQPNATNVRVSQVATEQIIKPFPKARASQVAVEQIIRPPVTRVRTSQIVVERILAISDLCGIKINNDAATTGLIEATLNLEYGNKWVEMRFRNSDWTWSSWMPVALTKTWALAAGSSGTKTVYAQFRDEVGTESPEVSDSITLGVPSYPMQYIGVYRK